MCTLRIEERREEKMVHKWHLVVWQRLRARSRGRQQKEQRKY